MTSPYWLPFRLLQCDKSNLDRRGLLFWLPLGRHACFKGNLFGEVLLNQLPFRLPQHDKSNLNRRGLLFWLPLGRHACFKGNLFGKLLAYWLPFSQKSCHFPFFPLSAWPPSSQMSCHILFSHLLAWLPLSPMSCHTFGTIFQNALFTKNSLPDNFHCPAGCPHFSLYFTTSGNVLNASITASTDNLSTRK